MELSTQVRRDFTDILRWTVDQFGRRQAITYRAALNAAIRALGDGPDVLGSVPRGDLGPGRRTLHVARGRRRGRHVLVYRAVDERVIEVVRILHDSMDLGRHVPPAGD